MTHITSTDSSGTATGGGGTRGGLEAWLVVVATACTVAVAWLLHYFPYHDATNNLARYVLMDRAWFGHPAPFVRVRLLPTPYIGLDLIGVAFVHLFGPAIALRAMATLLICVIPLGVYRLVCATCPARRGWALAAVQCSLSFYFLFGFFNFVAGIAAALLWLAAWWPRRDTASWPTRVWLSLGLALVFLVHLAGAMTVLVVLGVAWLIGVWRSWPGSGRLSWPAIYSSRLVMLGSACIAVAVYSVVWHLSLGYEAPASVPPWFRPLGSKVSNLASPFYSLSKTQMLVMAGGYLASLAVFLGVNRRTLRIDAVLASAVGFVLLYLVFPYSVDGAGFVDIRWMLPAILLPFAATASGPVPAQRRWLAVPFAMAILHAGVVLVQGRQIDRDLAPFRRVLDGIPPDARVLPLVADGKRHGRVDPFRHFAMWHTIDAGGGRVAGLLVEEAQFDSNPPPLLHKFFGHFQEPAHLYYPDEHWGTDSMPDLDWQRITRDFDYIVVAGRNPVARRAISAHADSTGSDGDVVLFRVRAAGVARRGVAAAGLFAAAVVAPMRPPSVPATPVSFAALHMPAPGIRDRLAPYPHPGGFYTQAQIDYVKKQIQAHAEPWASAYTRLMNSVAAKKNTQPNVPAVFNVPGYYEDKTAFFASTHEMTTDADAAYMMALAYQLNGDQNLADRSQRILTAWARTNTGVSGHDGQLTMAYMGAGLVLAGELLGNYPGWPVDDRAAFQSWVRGVYIGQAASAIQDRTNNWGEWGTFGMVIADHFLDDGDGLAAETQKLEHHIDQAIASDGHMPDETSRGQSGIWYTFFSLAPMTAAARVIENSGGPNLFTWASPSGKRMDTAITYLFNALQQPSNWSFAQNAAVPNGPRDDWAYDMFEAMADQFGNPQYAAYAAQRRPIMTSGHHYAWTFATLMKAPAGM